MSEPQAIEPNTWTPLLGTDVEVLVDGVEGHVTVEPEHYRNHRGEELVQFRWTMPAGGHVAIRAPKAPMVWFDPDGS
ncbi:hypothetical protein [Actinomadura fibrosa]|uniref:Uncharacterized protein n=1 Tax=Actinomadura fibrosa TaxID=111802 RepID=A0ABW2XD22_9ACTN|nr:hypothetical protein [Actinomadura fibrosa]